MSIDFHIAQSAKIQGVFIITPSIATDRRGNIYTSFLQEEIEKLLPNSAPQKEPFSAPKVKANLAKNAAHTNKLSFKHDKFSHSRQNVLRGIHGDTKTYKLVTCVYGEILQVVVDMREGSPTYLQHEKFIINYQAPKLILIPPNMGNAYFVRSGEAIYHYKLAYTGEYFDANEQFSLAYNDTRLGIDWGLNGVTPILSNRDLEALNLHSKEQKC